MDKQLDEGDVITLSTDNALDLPLPHPLLFQLHAIISRVIALKAAAGFPQFPGLERGNPDDYGVPAFVDNTYNEWLEHHQHDGGPPKVLPDRYDSSTAEPHILRWLKLTSAAPQWNNPDLSESDSDMEIHDEQQLKREHSEDSDTDDERPRKYTVVLGEVGQRMAEKWQLARSRYLDMDEEEDEEIEA